MGRDLARQGVTRCQREEEHEVGASAILIAEGLRGSANQKIQLLTSRYSTAEVESTPVAEIRIGPTGDVVLTGVNPLKLLR